MFLAGTYETGETARGCLCIYTFLIFPVVFNLKSINISNIEKSKLIILVFGQAMIMQFFAFYVW